MKKIILLLAGTLLWTLPAIAQIPDAQPLYPNGAPDSNGLSEKNAVSAADHVEKTAVADYFLFQADPDRATGQGVVICPGGAYLGTAYDHEGLQVAQWMNDRGITAVVLRYRMPNGHSDIPLKDAQAALKLMRGHAAEWRVDPHQVGIMGFSAGGHLASTVSTHFTDDAQRPDFAVLVYPVITMDPRYTHEVSRDELLGKNAPAELADRFSSEKQVSERTPVTFIALSDDDGGVVPVNSTMYYRALKEHGVPAELHIYPSGGHGWGWRDSFKYHGELQTSLDRWLKEIRK